MKIEKSPNTTTNNAEYNQREIKKNLGAIASNIAYAPKHYYENLNKEYPKYLEIIKPFTEKIDEGMAAEINFGIGLKHYNNEITDETTVNYFSKILNIEPPNIIYRKVNGEYEGAAAYNGKQNTLYFFKYKDDLSPEGQPLARDYGKLREIAHELWHAHQFDEIRNNKPRGNFYRNSISNYIKAKQDLVGYYTQPIEVEAELFAYETNKILTEYYIASCERLAKKAKEANDTDRYNLRMSQIDLLKKMLTLNPTSSYFDIDTAFNEITKRQCGFQNDE